MSGGCLQLALTSPAVLAGGGLIVLTVLSCSQWCLNLVFGMPCSDQVSPRVFFSFLSCKLRMCGGGELGSREQSLRTVSARHICCLTAPERWGLAVPIF